jgi:hypothetical protein
VAFCGLLGLAVLLVVSGLACRAAPDIPPPPAFNELIEILSEPGGYFDTDNLISNETTYFQVVDQLEPSGGAYIGVGPGQNLTYIARVRPRWAFIVDVRRENLLQHLLLNAILAKAETPYQYLCWLFSRSSHLGSEPPPASGIEEILRAFETTTPSEEVFAENQESILRHIQRELGISLAPEDRRRIQSIYRSFFMEQLELRFRSHGRRPMPHHPTYRTLLTARSPAGTESHFLSSADDYAFVRSLSVSGRLVPVVGDFAGSHALRAVGKLLKEQGETVTTFYVSNVEFYLFRSGRFAAYVKNVRSLPLRQDSLFIRSYFDYGNAHPARLPGYRSTMVLQRIPRFLDLFDSGAYRSYWDVCTLDYLQ